MNVDFEWDPAKAQVNLRKHGVTFEFATHAFRDLNRIERPDEGDHNGEERWQLIGRADEFVLMVVFTFRSDIIRIISARRTTHNEFIEYWNGQISV
jgi:hypothetical protein